MEDKRLDLAKKTITDLYGIEWRTSLRPGEPVEAQDLNHQLMMNAFADSWSRAGMDPKTKEILTIGMILAAGGCENELRSHLGGALKLGITKSEIAEIFIHAAAYLGTLRTASGWSVARRVFAEGEK